MKLTDVFEEIVVHVISYGYFYATIPFILGIIGAIILN